MTQLVLEPEEASNSECEPHDTGSNNTAGLGDCKDILLFPPTMLMRPHAYWLLQAYSSLWLGWQGRLLRSRCFSTL